MLWSFGMYASCSLPKASKYERNWVSVTVGGMRATKMRVVRGGDGSP